VLAIVPADDSPTCGVMLQYARASIVASHGHALLMRWKDQGKTHYGIGVGLHVWPGNMRTVHVLEMESEIRRQLAARLPLLDAEARLPRSDMREVFALAV
jgi:hypothetical protein